MTASPTASPTAPRRSRKGATDGRPRTVRWFLRPIIVLPAAALLVAGVALVTPEDVTARGGDPRLTTYSTSAMGASLYMELAQRLGWRVERQLTSRLAADSSVIRAVLDPAVMLRRAEVHDLLEHVRAGGALLAVLGDNLELLGDSLGLRVGAGGFVPLPGAGADTACSDSSRAIIPLWPDKRAHLYRLRWRRPPPAVVDTFVAVRSTDSAGAPMVRRKIPGRGSRPLVRLDAPTVTVLDTVLNAAVIGFAVGRGRLVVASDPDALRNDALRECSHGLAVPAVRALEYLAGGGAVPRQTIAFDEFHQGFGDQPGTLRAVAAYLGGRPTGRALLTVLAAGLVLLAGAAPRAIAPHDPERVERRSPLEHVDALARAYEQVHATRTASLRLLRGTRRRVERGGVAYTDAADELFLARAERSVPALSDDVAFIRRALHTRLPSRELARVGAALHRVETTLTHRT